MPLSAPEPPISFYDLAFARRSVQRISSRGTPYVGSELIGMPRVPQKVLDSIVYLYADKASADAGKNFGGTGFLVAIPSSVSNRHTFIYAVTNWHVAVKKGFSTVRVNMKNGDADTFEFDPSEWTFDPRFDVAVIPLVLHNEKHQYGLVPIEALMTRESAKRLNVGPGDDVFMAGRFVDHDGGKRNVPAIRFGHVSINPAPLFYEGREMDTYCIDLHSRTGHSGSPVFVYRINGQDLDEIPTSGGVQAQTKLVIAGTNVLMVLGIHYAQFPEEWELREKKKAAEASTEDAEDEAEPLSIEGKVVRGMSGMTCVLPAWFIRDLLNYPKLKAQRERDEAELLKQLGGSAAEGPVGESIGTANV